MKLGATKNPTVAMFDRFQRVSTINSQDGVLPAGVLPCEDDGDEEMNIAAVSTPEESVGVYLANEYSIFIFRKNQLF